MSLMVISDHDFLKIFGERIREIRVEREYSQEYVAYNICDRQILSRLEKGKMKYVDFNLLVKMTNKLGISLDKMTKRIFIEINSEFEIIEQVFRLISDCELAELEIFYDDLKINHAISRNSKIAKYIESAFLFHDKKYQQVIDNLADDIKPFTGMPSIIEILLVNCYFLSYLNIYYEDQEKIQEIADLIAKQKTSIEYYLCYYPEILIRMLTNLVDYYRLNGQIIECELILKCSEKSCYTCNLFDSLIDIYLNQLAINIEYQSGNAAEELMQKIDACLLIIDKPNKNEFIVVEYNMLKEIYQKYYGVGA